MYFQRNGVFRIVIIYCIVMYKVLPFLNTRLQIGANAYVTRFRTGYNRGKVQRCQPCAPTQKVLRVYTKHSSRLRKINDYQKLGCKIIAW